MEIKDENYDIRQVHFFNIIESRKCDMIICWEPSESYSELKIFGWNGDNRCVREIAWLVNWLLHKHEDPN